MNQVFAGLNPVARHREIEKMNVERELKFRSETEEELWIKAVLLEMQIQASLHLKGLVRSLSPEVPAAYADEILRSYKNKKR